MHTLCKGFIDQRCGHRLRRSSDSHKTSAWGHPLTADIVWFFCTAGNQNFDDIHTIHIFSDNIEQSESGGQNIIFQSVSDFQLNRIDTVDSDWSSVICNANIKDTALPVI